MWQHPSYEDVHVGALYRCARTHKDYRVLAIAENQETSELHVIFQTGENPILTTPLVSFTAKIRYESRWVSRFTRIFNTKKSTNKEKKIMAKQKHPLVSAFTDLGKAIADYIDGRSSENADEKSIEIVCEEKGPNCSMDELVDTTSELITEIGRKRALKLLESFKTAKGKPAKTIEDLPEASWDAYLEKVKARIAKAQSED